MGAGLTLIGRNFRNTGSPGLGTTTIAGGLILMAIYILLSFSNCRMTAGCIVAPKP
jgi:hypothetical protein